MARRKRVGEPDGGERTITVRYDSESIAKMALKVKAEGFVPAEDLKAEFGPEKFTRGIAVLFRDFRMFREVRRPWKGGVDVLGYEWADRRFSKSEIRKIPPALGFLVELTAPIPVKYSEYQFVTVKCRFTGAVLGGCPVPDADGTTSVNAFERDRNGNILILRYNLRAMMTRALPLIGKEQALGRRINFETVHIRPTDGMLRKLPRPVNDNGQGKGFCVSERLEDGVEFTVKAWIPTSIISVAEFLQAMTLAGQVVGLSPGRSAGFGDFEIIEAA